MRKRENASFELGRAPRNAFSWFRNNVEVHFWARTEGEVKVLRGVDALGLVRTQIHWGYERGNVQSTNLPFISRSYFDIRDQHAYLPNQYARPKFQFISVEPAAPAS